MDKFLILVLVLVTAMDELSYEMKEMRNRQREVIENIQKIKAEAEKDANGLVTPSEYGRLLKKIAQTTSGYRGLRPLPELIDEYVQGLEGLLDPEQVDRDLSVGEASKLLLKAVNIELTRMKSEL